MSSTANDDKKLRKVQRLETATTAGCGYGKAKKRMLHSFWNVLWPKLLEVGWTMIDGTGRELGAVYFVPKGINVSDDVKGVHYYDKVKAVVDRVLEERNNEELLAAKSYLAEMEKLEQDDFESTFEIKQTESPVRKKRSRPPRNSLSDLLNWKDNRKQFPKLCSRIGEEYQATALPEVRSYNSNNSSKDDQKNTGDAYSYDQVWDSKLAAIRGKTDFVHLTVPHNKREFCMVALHERNYSIGGLFEALNSFAPLDGSEYFLGTYKQSDDYRLLKVVRVQERADKQAEGLEADDSCRICREGGNLLICETCEDAYHISCLRPPLMKVPEGDWDCDDCVRQRLLDVRDLVLKESCILLKEPEGDIVTRNQMTNRLYLEDISKIKKKSTKEGIAKCDEITMGMDENAAANIDFCSTHDSVHKLKASFEKQAYEGFAILDKDAKVELFSEDGKLIAENKNVDLISTLNGIRKNIRTKRNDLVQRPNIQEATKNFAAAFRLALTNKA